MLANNIEKTLQGSSAIRKMFEEGIRLKKERGEEAICDLTLGNPCLEPPKEVKDALTLLAQSTEKKQHQYMPNAGIQKTRSFIANELVKESNLPFTANHIIMCVGAGGGLNVVFKSLLNEKDTVVSPSPYFAEYRFYAQNYNASLVPVKTKPDFSLDLDGMAKAITAKTKIVLLNSPNNPTGAVYTSQELTDLGVLLRKKSDEYGVPITLLADEPYKEILYEGNVPCIFSYYENTVVVTSYSKSLALPAERIGYIAISPHHSFHKKLFDAACICTRILGFVNAPAFMQRLLPLVANIKVDLSLYKKNRDLLHQKLNEIGYLCSKPQGAFYLFIPIPRQVKESEFIQLAQKEGLLLVAGSAFGLEGYFRVAYCVEEEVIQRSITKFQNVWDQCTIKSS